MAAKILQYFDNYVSSMFGFISTFFSILNSKNDYIIKMNSISLIEFLLLYLFAFEGFKQIYIDVEKFISIK